MSHPYLALFIKETIDNAREKIWHEYFARYIRYKIEVDLVAEGLLTEEQRIVTHDMYVDSLQSMKAVFDDADAKIEEAKSDL